jgi:methionyl-tRNA synthetase
VNDDNRGAPILITATAPTPNGPLHVGHLSGPYLAADIARRALAARGSEVIAVGGLDPNQNHVVLKSESQGRPPDELLDDYSARIRQAWDQARIAYDVFVDPRQDPAYGRAVANLVSELVSTKAATMVDATLFVCPSCRRTMHHAYVAGDCPVCCKAGSGGTCEGCATFLTVDNLVAPRCAMCWVAPVPRPARVPVLRLEDYRQGLVETLARAALPSRVRALIHYYLTNGLPDVVLAYPTDWGIPWPGPGGQEFRVDVWVEMGLGYLFAMARHFDADVVNCGTAESYVAAWKQAGPMWHFLGFDNAFYYAVLFPSLFLAAGMPVGSLGGIIVNEFYRLYGKKFSTSRGHAIWADEFLGDEEPEWVRLYLCWDRPDNYESDFVRSTYDAFRRHFRKVLEQPSGTPLSRSLARQEIVRAKHALRLDTFDPALAVRCALVAAAVDPEPARELLGWMASGDPSVPSLSSS